MYNYNKLECEIIGSFTKSNYVKVYTTVWNKENKNQEWTFVDDSIIQNVGTGRLLDSDDKGVVYSTPTDAGNYYQWRVI